MTKQSADPNPATPPHRIALADVKAWLAGGQVPVITTHRTDRVSAAAIWEHGVNLAWAAPDGGWGQGFYTSTRPDPRYGEVEIRVAVRLQAPWIVDDPLRGGELLDEWTRESDPDDFRAAIRARGYDGVMVRYSSGELVVVAFEEAQVRIVITDLDT